jgi:hypothetical protein
MRGHRCATRRVRSVMFAHAGETVSRPCLRERAVSREAAGTVRAEHDADASRSFAAVEWHYSDRLLEPCRDRNHSAQHSDGSGRQGRHEATH